MWVPLFPPILLRSLPPSQRDRGPSSWLGHPLHDCPESYCLKPLPISFSTSELLKSSFLHSFIHLLVYSFVQCLLFLQLSTFAQVSPRYRALSGPPKGLPHFFSLLHISTLKRLLPTSCFLCAYALLTHSILTSVST
jgi:hypothetical protein